jgi:septal ring factor EnvC (AmiA/AmiB activator)
LWQRFVETNYSNANRERRGKVSETKTPETTEKFRLADKMPSLWQTLSAMKSGMLSFPGPRKQASATIVHLVYCDARKDIAAIEAKHAAEIAELQTQRNYEWDRRHKAEDELQTARKEIATLRATMAGMVCGACKGSKQVPDPELFGAWIFCPVCQPKKEG